VPTGGPDGNKKKQKQQQRGMPRGEVSTESHESMRNGLQSVMSALDDMLADMKSK
jgi:hypothetical protein